MRVEIGSNRFLKGPKSAPLARVSQNRILSSNATHPQAPPSLSSCWERSGAGPVALPARHDVATTSPLLTYFLWRSGLVLPHQRRGATGRTKHRSNPLQGS